ncbi:tautomerase family protein [Streptomyces sp. NPDC052309]|uniref:Tautomerase family protein n=1 Tax=Streptomyces griseicoloratus TaxID=2752516 RepID=A0A926QTD6_9ACTN|nr:tautomerase family protein [Streptomyces griseicoloratus]MBD0422770.1 tautomerase family protein [Streptomyces griseicoloratus]
MPHFTVHLREESLDGTVEPKLIAALADAVGSVYGEEFRRLVGVDLIGVPQHRRGIGGVPTDTDAPLVTFSLREPALRHPRVPEAPARLVAAITDALAGVLGEGVREQTVVSLAGVPDGRSGVGGVLM